MAYRAFMITLSVTDALSRAWNRMVTVLFKPFDIGKWFIIGFSAWLVQLEEGGPSSSFNFMDTMDEDSMSPILGGIGEFIADNLALVIGIASVAILFFIAISLLLLWLAARGKFMLLDNLAFNRGAISIPWKDYARQANSLFLWEIVYSLIVFTLIGLIAGVAIVLGISLGDGEAAWIVLAAVLIPLMILLVTISLLIWMCLSDFVIPVMLKHKVSTVQGWRMVFPAIKANLGKVILYTLFKVLIVIACMIVIVLFSLLTCCCGFLLICIPYINAVILLPMTALLKLYGAEFMRGFGPDYDIFAVQGIDTPPPPPPPGPDSLDGTPNPQAIV